jgi:hypothetical protein
MSEEDRIAYDAARDIPENQDDGYVTDCEPMDINDVLDGTAQLDVSHAGGEFRQIMEEELHQQSRSVLFRSPPFIYRCVFPTGDTVWIHGLDEIA